MGKPGISTCKKCGNKFVTKDMVIYRAKKYCSICATEIKEENERIKKEKNKEKELKKLEAEKLKKENKPSDNQYRLLISYICEQFQIDKPTGLMIKQIKDMKDMLNYTYAGIQYTLWYCIEILEIKPIEKYGVYFVREHYEEASRFWDEQNKLIETVEKPKIRNVKVTSNRINQKTSSSLFNLNDLTN